MKTLIQFQGFEGFEHHFDFVNELVESSVEKFDTSGKFKARIKLKELKSKHQFSKDKFECELTISGDRRKGEMFFKKSADNFYDSIRRVMRAAEKTLRRESKTRLARKRKSYIPARKLNYINEAA